MLKQYHTSTINKTVNKNLFKESKKIYQFISYCYPSIPSNLLN